MTDDPSREYIAEIGLVLCWLKGSTPFLASTSDRQDSYHRVRTNGIVILSQGANEISSTIEQQYNVDLFDSDHHSEFFCC